MHGLSWIFAAGLLTGSLQAEPAAPAALRDLTGAKWLWRSGVPEAQLAQHLVPGETVFFRRDLTLPQGRAVTGAWITATADNAVKLTVNGTELFSSSDWSTLSVGEFARLLQPGVNRIEAEVLNEGNTANPGGFVARVQVDFAEGEPLVLLTDATWQSSLDGEEGAASAVLGLMGTPPWGLLGHSRRFMPPEFTRFLVPGREAELESLRTLFFEYYTFFPYATLWDPWTPMALIWPSAEGPEMQQRFRALLGGRYLTEEGYVSTHQHRGMAHELGWPFPLWTQVAGWGWHFSTSGNPFGGAHFGVIPQHHLDGFGTEGFSAVRYDQAYGLHAELEPGAMLQTPPLRVKAVSAPFFRLEWWAEGLQDAQPYLEWTTVAEPEFSKERRIYFEPATDMKRQTVSMIALYEVTPEDALFTGFRIGFGNRTPARIAVQALMTASDSRHNINNSIWVQGCADYLRLTGDMEFLKQQIDRLRRAIRFAVSEFQTREHQCIYTPWRGHDGRSGIMYEDGRKIIRPGFGVGNNYWDLMPFGGRDFLATLYFYDALNRMAEIEEVARQIPEIPKGFDPAELRAHAREIRDFSREFFWNEQTGRFYAAVDFENIAHDYGYTFLNLEAIYYGLASEEQARCILDWISGKRIVEGDTSQGADIYHWRFAPRASTLRNIDYYSSVWSAPETLEFGDQIQDGGAVLGFSYHDLMSRLKVYGPDNAWQRLREIIQWHDEVQAEGGVRAYYAKPGRGSLQGGGTAGGLGIDSEFFESALVPQLMLYGFMGFEPRLDGFAVKPQLPSDWPSLTITGVRFQGRVYDFTTDGKTFTLNLKDWGEPATLRWYRSGGEVRPLEISPARPVTLNLELLHE